MKTNETFSPELHVANVNLALRDSKLSLSNLLALHSTVEILLLKNPKLKSALNSKLGQIEKRIIKAKSFRANINPRLAEHVLLLIKENDKL